MKNKYIPLVQSAVNFIEDNLNSEITVKEISLKSGLSIWEFQRIFRSMVGDSIGNYLRHRRLTLAARRLKDTDDKIIDIAMDSSFNSQEAFSRAFKSYFHQTPNQVRKGLTNIITKNKPIITPELLNFLNGGIVMQPEVVSMPSLKLVGMKIQLQEVFSKYNNFNDLVFPIWNEFISRRKEIKNIKNNKNLGLLKNEDKSLEEGDHFYFSCVQVSKFENIPRGMVTIEVPSQKYAVFTNTGLGDKTSYTMNYIYGTWLPTSEYLRSYGDEFEIFDENFSRSNDNSVSKYYLPIKNI